MNKKDNYKDMKKWKAACKRQHYRYYNKTAFAPRGGEPFSLLEDKMIMEHLVSDRELSTMLGRSMGAIQKRRWRLKNELNEA